MISYKKINQFASVFLSMILLAACNNASQSGGGQTDSLALVQVTNNPQNPTSIYLKLVNKTEGDTSISYQAKGLYQQDTLGFILEVSKQIPAGINKDGTVNQQDGFKKGSFTFKTSGAESDLFVSTLAKLWHVDSVSHMKSTPIQPLAFSSNKTSVDLNKLATNSFKLFFEEDSPTPGEIFFTFDTYKRSIEFQERDAENRFTIVHALGE